MTAEKHGNGADGTAERPIARPLRDRGTLYSILNRAWSIMSTLGFVAIAVIWLSPELQGFYFTFVSLLVLLQVADMGFGIVLAQFASHEWVDLHLGSDGQVSGATRAMARLGSLVRIGGRWYAMTTSVFFLVLGAGGDLFFSVSPDAAAVDWRTPWWLLSFAAALYLLLSPVQCLLEGCGRVLTAQRNLLIANILASVAGWLVLYYGGELYALVVLFGVRTVIGHTLNTRAALPYMRVAWTTARSHAIDWKKEFWPLQWRIWISWLTGFLMFQSFAPIAFQIDGAIAAGQIGIMVQAYNAVNQLASARLSVDQPRMGMFAARADFDGLRRLVRFSTKFNLVAALLLAGAAIGLAYLLLLLAPDLGKRIGPLLAFGLFVMTALPMQFSNVQTAAVRFQKKEPFVCLNIVCALIMVVASVLVAAHLGAQYMAIVFVGVSTGILVPGVFLIYRQNMGRER